MNKLLTRVANSFGINYINSLNTNFEGVNDDLVRYFKNEYGKEWKFALDKHLYDQSIKNDKKAA